MQIFPLKKIDTWFDTEEIYAVCRRNKTFCPTIMDRFLGQHLLDCSKIDQFEKNCVDNQNYNSKFFVVDWTLSLLVTCS